MDEWFKARVKWHKPIMKLSDAEAGRLMKALWSYATHEELGDLGGREGILLEMCIAELAEDQEHRSNVSAARRAAGTKGGRPKISPENAKANESKKSNCFSEKAKEANESKKSYIRNKKEDNIADAIYAHTRESGGGFLDDDEADDLMGELNSVLDAAHDAGFPDNQATFDRLTALCADYTAAWVLEALKVCVDRGQSSPGYLAGVLQRYREQGGLDSQRKQETYTPNRLVIDDAPQADRAKLAALADKARALVEKQRALPQ